MRSWLVVVVMVMVVATGPGCIGDSCDPRGMQASNQMFSVPPGAVLTLALRGCSTCDHSETRAIWDYDPGTNPTGNIEVTLSPHCAVRDTTSVVPFNASQGTANNNYRNCGDVIDIDGYVTNRTDVTLTALSATLTCATAE